MLTTWLIWIGWRKAIRRRLLLNQSVLAASGIGERYQCWPPNGQEMEKHMSGIEASGALGAAAAKYGGLAKLGAMFGASAFGAALIAAYHPETRKDTWWRALGAGIGGVVIGKPAVLAAAHYLPWLGGGDFGVESAILFLTGSLFWGIVGTLQNLQKKIKDRGADVVADKLGLDDKQPEVHP